LQQQVKNLTAEQTIHTQHNNQIHSGGYSSPIFKFDFLQPYITSDSSNISTTAHFRYVDHVDDIKLLNYPADQYVHTSIPLNTLCEILPTSKARKIALVHGVSAGSRCTPAQLLASTVNHSCLACTRYLTIFVPDKNKAQLVFDHVIKTRKNQSANGKSNNQTGKLKDIKLNPVTPEFPPNILDRNDLSYTIISSACSKMDKSNIEEAGCSVW
jgi:hypothetical protein